MHNTFKFLVTGRRGIFPEVERLGCKADHSPASSAWMKNDYIYIYTYIPTRLFFHMPSWRATGTNLLYLRR
jgi:hypothetical protein